MGPAAAMAPKPAGLTGTSLGGRGPAWHAGPPADWAMVTGRAGRVGRPLQEGPGGMPITARIRWRRGAPGGGVNLHTPPGVLVAELLGGDGPYLAAAEAFLACRCACCGRGVERTAVQHDDATTALPAGPGPVGAPGPAEGVRQQAAAWPDAGHGRAASGPENAHQ